VEAPQSICQDQCICVAMSALLVCDCANPFRVISKAQVRVLRCSTPFLLTLDTAPEPEADIPHTLQERMGDFPEVAEIGMTLLRIIHDEESQAVPHNLDWIKTLNLLGKVL